MGKPQGQSVLTIVISTAVVASRVIVVAVASVSTISTVTLLSSVAVTLVAVALIPVVAVALIPVLTLAYKNETNYFKHSISVSDLNHEATDLYLSFGSEISQMFYDGLNLKTSHVWKNNICMQAIINSE